MDETDPILDALVQWEARRAEGKILTPQELCPLQPALWEVLRERIARRERLGPLLEPLSQATQIASATPFPEVPGYEILQVVGHGGMGIVYKARQTRLDRLIALKMIHGQALPHDLVRFRTEAEAVARLDHPHIIQIHEVGEHAGRPYLVLEWADGGNLAAHLDGTPLPARTAAALLLPLVQAVAHAHARGIVHRDLKPVNILLQERTPETSRRPEDKSTVRAQQPRRPEGQAPAPTFFASSAASQDLGVPGVHPKISDFGLAKLLDSDQGHTETGAVLGTPHYMAPEQASGGKDIGPATDVYALGVILYELLTGQMPFRGASVLETLDQVRTQEPVSPRRLQPGVPRNLETICLKCLSKDPGRRYPTARALGGDLGRFLNDEPIQARPVHAVERLWRWGRRNPVAASLLLVLIGVAIGGPAAALLWREQRDQAWTNLERALKAEQEAGTNLWQSYLEHAEALRGTHQAGQRHHGLEILARAAALRPSREVRDAAIACLALPDLKVIQVRQVRSDFDHMVAFDSKLEHFAARGPTGAIQVRRLADGQVIQSFPNPGQNALNWKVLFSPNDRYLAVTAHQPRPESVAMVFDLVDGAPRVQAPCGRSGVCLDFSPDGRRVVLGGQDNSLVLFDCASGKELRRLAKTCVPHTVTFHPAGRHIAVTSFDDRVVEVRDSETGAVQRQYRHPAPVLHTAWRGDGRVLAVGGDDRRTYVWDAATGQQVRVLQGHLGAVVSLMFNHAGDLLASASWGGTSRLWDPISGQELVRASGFALGFRTDDAGLAFLKEFQGGVWEVSGCRECRTLHHGLEAEQPRAEVDPGPGNVEFGLSGRVLAAAGRDGVRLWEPATMQELAHLPAGRCGTVAFQSGGDGLVSYGTAGLHYWPTRLDGATLRLGPPRLLERPEKGPFLRAVWSQDGRRLAYLRPRAKQAVLLPVADPPSRKVFDLAPGAVSVALSPDGRWLVVGPYRSDSGTEVWDTGSGKRACYLVSDPGREQTANVGFTLDGRLLVTGEQEAYRLWRVGSWETERVIPRADFLPSAGALAFAEDGRLLAIARSTTTVQLVDLRTGEEVATLESPDRQPIAALAFAPDGSQLAVATYSHRIQLWNLALLRQELAPLNLDWELPPTPAIPRGEPLHIQVDLGDFRPVNPAP